MFGLKALFAAIDRLTAAITQSAQLFETANAHLVERLALDEAPKAIEHEPTKRTRK